MYDVIVIGGGPAGVTAALRARELGAAVALVERGAMGGTCTNDGCVPTRVLARAARLVVNGQQFADYGLATPALQVDIQQLLTHAQHIVYTIHQKKQLVAHLGESGVNVFSEVGPARFVDPQTIELPDGRQLRAHKFILCAGGRARRLDFPGADLAMTHSDVWSLKKLPASVLVAGGAATGCQLASILRAFGAQVTLIERLPDILRVEDAQVSQAMDSAFRQRGIELLTGIGDIRQLTRNGHHLQIEFEYAGQVVTRTVEAVILSTGWLGNLEPLNLAAAGVQTNGPYVTVDDHLRTSVPHIFAAGDINGRMMLVQTAGSQARLAAENAVLGTQVPLDQQIVPHGGFTDPEYASVGLTEAQARATLACVVAVVPYHDMDRAVIDGRTEGFCKLIVAAETRQIVGAHVVGEQAMEIVHVAAAGMAAGMRIEQLAELQIAYPTYTAILGLAARQTVRALGDMPLTLEWRALARPHAEWERSSQGS